MDYKNTLNLPKTDFSMKADLPKKEPLFLTDWYTKNIYKLIRAKSQGRPKYILHDGPPYANGDIHIGHALNKTLKDIIVKYKTMRGCDSGYVPGWDCHGLPVEHQLFKELKINKYQIAQIDFRKKAYEYASKYVNIQREQFKRLGVFGDWDNPYLTLAPDYEEAIIASLGELVKKGYIYRGLKPVNWCFKCETALAEAEVEYENHTSPSMYVKFKIDENKDFHKESFLVIWTTTPWTLIANVAVAVHPDLTYLYLKTDKGNLILAKNLSESVLAQIGSSNHELIREIKGRDLENLVYAHPFGLRKGRVVLADYVAKDEGTGLVHTAPGHGMEDYLTGLAYKLEVIMPVDEKGKFDKTAQEFAGLNVFDANKLILEKLDKSGALLFSSQVQHSYPHCWRCKSAIIFRATKQWFLNIDHQDLRKRLLQSIRQDVKWIPPSGQERISAMVELRPHWCLSRQRYWGVPIPAIVCANCREEFLIPEVIENLRKYSLKESSDSWFIRPLEDFIPSGFKCPDCGKDIFSKGSDILDVWFDSGVSHQAVLKKRPELDFPCELYLEGSDQHRGWFQSSLIPATCIDNKPPYKNVLTHGFVVDADGRKMSKSLGNVISPFDIIKDYGADILRMWVASSDYNEDIRISPVILTRLSEAYRKIRNTVRFILSNLYDFEPAKDKVGYDELERIDKWVLLKLGQVLASAENAYDNFEFYKAYKAIYDFCNESLSMYYLDMVKGRLYTFAAKSQKRRAAQTAMCEVLNALVRIMSPILVFTAEEIWRNMPKEARDSEVSSVHLLDWPVCGPEFSKVQTDEITYLDLHVIELIPEVAKELEELRNKGEIGSSFDAKINLLTKSPDRYKFLTSLKPDLCEIFKVSQVDVEVDQALAAEIRISASKAGGRKCVRCWNYSAHVGLDNNHPELCDRCIDAIGEESSIEKKV